MAASGRRWPRWLFDGKFATLLGMDKHEHAALLRAAIAEQGYGRQALADAMGRNYRTVGNWTSKTNPTVPSAEERAVLRKLLGPYDSPGDAVERAVMRSDLTDDRQYDVIGFYKRKLREQREEATG